MLCVIFCKSISASVAICRSSNHSIASTTCIWRNFSSNTTTTQTTNTQVNNEQPTNQEPMSEEEYKNLIHPDWLAMERRVTMRKLKPKKDENHSCRSPRRGSGWDGENV